MFGAFHNLSWLSRGTLLCSYQNNDSNNSLGWIIFLIRERFPRHLLLTDRGALTNKEMNLTAVMPVVTFTRYGSTCGLLSYSRGSKETCVRSPKISETYLFKDTQRLLILSIWVFSRICLEKKKLRTKPKETKQNKTITVTNEAARRRNLSS